VIRRRDQLPAAHKFVFAVVTKPHNKVENENARYSGIEIEPRGEMEKLLAKGRLELEPSLKCNRAYDDIYAELKIAREKISPPCHLAPGFSLRNHLSPFYNLLLVAEDRQLPIAPLLGVIAAQVTAPMTLDDKASVLVMGCEVSVANAALHGALQARHSNVRFFASLGIDVEARGSVCPTDFLVKYIRKNDGVLEKDGAWFKKAAADPTGKEGHQIDVLVISAQALVAMSGEDVATLGRSVVRHRIVVYGTNLFNINGAAAAWTGVMDGGPEDKGGNNKDAGRADHFELRLGFAKGVGLAMFERRFHTKYVYAPEARPAPS
jgi:hypothetical protein